MSALSKWQSLYSIVLDDAVELFDYDKKKKTTSLDLKQFSLVAKKYNMYKHLWYMY